MPDLGKAAFNMITEIFNKIITIRPHSSSADGWENPHATGAGQLVTSEQENWHARKARLGATKMAYANAVNVPTAGSTSLILNVTPKSGNVAYITHIIVSSDGPGVAYLGHTIGNDLYYATRRMFSASSFDLKLDGSIMVRDEFRINFNADAANTKVWASAIWMEVAE